MHELTGTLKDYAWGSTTAIPTILGTTPTGHPQAEYWLGAHPSSPSLVAGEPLDALVRERPEILGEASRARFGDHLPYMVKLLAAAEQLSLQAHPSREQAVAGYAREDAAGIPLDDPTRTYRDQWPKPELLSALGPFEALYGFRDPAATLDLLHHLDPEGNVDGLEQVMASLDLPGDPTTAVRRTFLDLLHGGHGGLVDALTEVARQHLDAPGELGLFARTAVDLAALHPGDPGVVAALMLNRMHLERFDAVYVPAGLLHAYIHGTGVEVMASSDNVLRGGLTAKHVDVDGLGQVVDFTPIAPTLVEHTEVAEGVWHYRTPAPEFSVWRLDAPAEPVRVPADGTARIVLVVEGEMRLAMDDGRSRTLAQGSSVLLTATESGRLEGPGTTFLTSPGV